MGVQFRRSLTSAALDRSPAKTRAGLVVTVALLIAATSFKFAQGASIQVEQPWSRATPTGASTGAVYLTITNKSHDTDRLLGASSDVADKLQIHEMKVVNGTMEMREVSGGLSVPAGGSVVLKAGQLSRHADRPEKVPQGR
jgi:copper(I)-binding protein